MPRSEVITFVKNWITLNKLPNYHKRVIAPIYGTAVINDDVIYVLPQTLPTAIYRIIIKQAPNRQIDYYRSLYVRLDGGNKLLMITLIYLHQDLHHDVWNETIAKLYSLLKHGVFVQKKSNIFITDFRLDITLIPSRNLLNYSNLW